MESNGHAIFENDSRDYNLNIVGIRSKTAKLDSFGCQLLLAWKHHKVWTSESFRITTYPGEYYLRHRLLNPRGCAILAPGQYRGCYKIDQHRGKYDALCQRLGPVKVFRDKDRDTNFDLDPSTLMEGMFGINIHNSPDGQVTLRVGMHSAGCQVFSSDSEYAEFMKILYRSRNNFGNKFTYTLINE